MATSPTKEATPAASDAKASSATAADKKDLFSEKEQKLIVAAMFSLKSGPPEIDYEKFVKAGEFNTLKTAQNTWGKIKKKLVSLAPPAAAEGEEGSKEGKEGEEGAEVPKTPKAKATPKKRGKKADADADGEGADDAEEGSPKKKGRKTPVKKGKKAKEEEAAAEEETTAAADVKDENMEE